MNIQTKAQIEKLARENPNAIIRRSCFLGDKTLADKAEQCFGNSSVDDGFPYNATSVWDVTAKDLLSFCRLVNAFPISLMKA